MKKFNVYLLALISAFSVGERALAGDDIPNNPSPKSLPRRKVPYERLAAAIRNDDLESLFAALWKGDDIYSTYTNAKRTMLHLAAACGSTRLARYFLIWHYFHVNQPTLFNDTPLHVAVENGQLNMVQFLLERGANPNAMNDWRQTPLHLAARGNSEEIANLLIEYDADRRARDQNGRTPHEYART